MIFTETLAMEVRSTEADARVHRARFARFVTCVWCGNHYRSVFPGDNDQGLQGSHCASDVVQEGGEWFVRGGYGSDEHDMHRYRFETNPPVAPADPVCDECISERLRAGDLRAVGLEFDRRPADFGPRPHGTWGLVYQIRELVQKTEGMRRLVDASCAEHVAHGDASCKICTEILEYRKYQRWTGELEDGGDKYPNGCAEVAEQMREAARQLERLAVFWESRPFSTQT
jgi:hypothetical protein